MRIKSTSTRLLLILLQLLLCTCNRKIEQLNPKKLQESIQQNDYTLVYFYSASCQYCQKFTPKFEQLAKVCNISGINFGKIDGPAYKDVTEKYNVYSYPSIILFWKGIDAPIFYRKERQVAQLLQFLNSHTKVLSNFVTKQRLDKLSKEERDMGVVYIGPSHTLQQNITTVLSILQPYRPFAILDANTTQPYMQIKQVIHKNFDINYLHKQIRSAFAKVFEIEEEGWLRIHQAKQIGIVQIDTTGGDKNKNVYNILQKLAKEMPDFVFMRLDPSQEQFKEAIDALQLEWEDNLIAVDKKYDAKFVAQKPYTEQSIRQFINKVLNLSAPLYMRSEKTTHKQKLTLANFDSKINQPKDVVVFLYRTDDRLQAKFMDLFKYLTKKLQQNQNILLLRCNLSKNEIQMKLGFQVKVTPAVIFYGHRMKDKPVHYLKSTISAANVIDFIMENTTFDWEDQWSEL